jgi:hypothetical protein
MGTKQKVTLIFISDCKCFIVSFDRFVRVF